jgi:hypothetical protein
MFFKLPDQAPGRIPAYVQYNTRDLERANLYKPAPYLSIHHCHALDLIRLRSQAWPQYIPTHLHLSGRKVRQEYQHRHCEYCHQQGVLGDETHIFLRCPATASLIGETVAQIDKKLRLFDVLPWSSFTDTKRVSILLGNPPPSLIKKHTKGWMQESQVCPLAPHIHDEASVARTQSSSPTPTSFGI